ncbi:unnamed protein product [Strongylus vulgaris]|uniref:Dystrophin-1-like spectrin repeat domain-containing protein n=1 Tax=Strongylus vulgaris TaxID=40348 RepID=A0A3P7JR08_STRVU|nr:unnamed protein product [Strongylus vulgaris]
MIDEDGEITDEDTVEPEYQGRLESTESSTKDEEKRDPRMPPHMNARDTANWQSLTQLRHWLNELERDASLTVDLADTAAIKEMTNTVQGIMDHIRMKIMDVVGIQDASAAPMVKLKARELVRRNTFRDRSVAKRVRTFFTPGSNLLAVPCIKKSLRYSSSNFSRLLTQLWKPFGLGKKKFTN